MGTPVKICEIAVGGGSPVVLIAGPCVIEDENSAYDAAAYLRDLAGELDLPFIFKASYDKANRTSVSAYRGPGISAGLRILANIKARLGIPVLSDVHTVAEIPAAAAILDVIQIPAFLCRQTDLVVAAAGAGKPVNIKKGQFLAPWDVAHIIAKVRSAGNERILLTERGTQFGYNNLVVDFRGIAIMQAMGCPVIFDATHSVQLPGGAAASSGGQREYAPLLARAAVAAGADGVFVEVHRDPEKARCDGPNSLSLDTLRGLLQQLLGIREALENTKVQTEG
jgi:2-dehydro-3-deoxyphosphooctonate aldolase (KDO 8-P synthase)